MSEGISYGFFHAGHVFLAEALDELVAVEKHQEVNAAKAVQSLAEVR